jgi:hypothetical protein
METEREIKNQTAFPENLVDIKSIKELLSSEFLPTENFFLAHEIICEEVDDWLKSLNSVDKLVQEFELYIEKKQTKMNKQTRKIRCDFLNLFYFGKKKRFNFSKI